MLYDGNGDIMLRIKRYSVSHHGFWAATDPNTIGDPLVTFERTKVWPLTLTITFHNPVLTNSTNKGKSKARDPFPTLQ